MKDIIIYSNRLKVHVNAFGAELKGVEMDALEYLWQGDAITYPRTSPTLFPITGRFLSDTYYVGNTAYHMEPNGFAMNSNFQCVEKIENSVAFQLMSNPEMRTSYPFDFCLTVVYVVKENCLTVSYQVDNCDDRPMPFCIGCHTAYKWPLQDNDSPEDYRLLFEKKEQLESFNPFGWRQPFIENTRIRSLTHSLFENYTRSITNIKSDWIEYGSDHHTRCVRIERQEFPFMAIWSLPNPDAAFVCLEPCTSIHPGDQGCTHLEDRNGAIILEPGASRYFTFHLIFN